MRKAESFKRSKYKCFESERNQLLPILNWQDTDVWQYISENKLPVNPLYREGFRRIGCVLCPFAPKSEIKLSFEKFPKIVNCWKSAANRYIEKRMANGWIPKEGVYTNGDEYFNWWISK